MSFYDDVDETGVVENHIKRVLGLEDDQAKQIIQIYTDMRQDLVDKLAHVPARTFTAQHLRGVLAQVEGATTALKESLSGNMAEGSLKAAMFGVEDLLKEIRTFASFRRSTGEPVDGAVTPINLNAALIANDTANLVIQRYQTSMDAYGADVQARIARGLTQAAIGESNYDQVVGYISRFFTGEEWRVHRIVRTELHNTYNMGKLNGMGELEDGDMPDILKTLMHPMDARTGEDSKYAARLGLVAKVNEPFVYIWNGQVREFMAPPDRPNDRAILVPYSEAWGPLDTSAQIPGRFPKA